MDNSQAALAQLQQAQSQSQNPNDILAGQRQQLGVQGAQDTVTGLRGAINNTTKLLKQVAPSVMGRTGSSLVTNAQATKQISNEQAPISQNLTDQTTQYGQADQDLLRLQDQAKEAASGIYQGQQDKQSYLQNIYNTLYQKEQDTAKAAAEEQDRQESTRRFNEQLALDKSKASQGSGGITLGGGPLGSSVAGPTMSKKSSGGGFAFTDSGGAPISAAKYAQLSGQSIGNVLYAMGQAGDAYAQQAYNTIKAAPGVVNPNYLKSNYSSLFWGT